MSIRVAILIILMHPAAMAAMEASRSLTSGTMTIDPMTPTLLFWHGHPATIVVRPPEIVFSQARAYHLDAMESQSAGLVFHRSSLAIAIAVTSLGRASIYRESDVSLTLGRRVRPWLCIAASIHMIQLQFGSTYRTQRFALADVGLVGTSGRLEFGASMTDMGAPSVNGRITMPRRYRAAVSYRYSPRLVLRTGAEYRGHWEIGIGETLLIQHSLHLRAELHAPPLRLLAGFRLTLGDFFVDLIHRDHPELGSDQILAIGWHL